MFRRVKEKCLKLPQNLRTSRAWQLVNFQSTTPEIDVWSPKILISLLVLHFYNCCSCVVYFISVLRVSSLVHASFHTSGRLQPLPRPPESCRCQRVGEGLRWLGVSLWGALSRWLAWYRATREACLPSSVSVCLLLQFHGVGKTGSIKQISSF